jgi:hypothetical protein
MKAPWYGRSVRWHALTLAAVTAALSFGAPTRAQAALPHALTFDTPAAAPGLLQADPCLSADVQMGGGGGNNIVLLENRVNDVLTARGIVRVNQIPGPSVAPVNCAFASSTCIRCQTLSVALQIDLISRTATFIAPRNVARAQNIGCHNCQTLARALQYVIQVDDPTSVPPEVRSLAQAMNDELRVIQTDRTLTLDQAMVRVDGVLARFQDLAASLNDQRSQAVDPLAATTTPNVGATASGPIVI